MSVNEVLAMETTRIVDTTGAAIDGYRIVKRDTATLVSEALDIYTAMCSVIAATIDEILQMCSALGYNVTSPGDNLRLIDDLNSHTMYEIPNLLPILIMAFWDNALVSRSVTPGKDGSACMVRLDGSYLYPANPIPVLKAVSRTVREDKTIELLKRPGGRWKNGWYEDLAGTKWYSDISSVNSTSQQPGSDFSQQQFNMCTRKPVCENKLGCSTNLMTEKWGSAYSCTGYDLWMTSVTIANGERYGLFLYEGSVRRTSKNVYNVYN